MTVTDNTATAVIQPVGYHLLVRLQPVNEKTKGGIIRPETTRQAEQVASVVGKVLALGAMAYADAEKFPEGPWCQPGDFILMRQYSGTRFQRDGYPYQYRLINDDAVEAVLRCDPEEIKRAF